MAVVLMKEFDLPKDEARYRKFMEFTSWRKGVAAKYQELINTLDKMSKEGALKFSNWADTTGHIIIWWEFESVESFAKLRSIDNGQKHSAELHPLVDNMRIRFLRPAQMVPNDVMAS